MDSLSVFGSKSPFDVIRRTGDSGIEYWTARDLMPLLGYSKWQKFADAIDRAKMACNLSGNDEFSHFTDAGNLVERPQGGGSRQQDYHLSRYGCYLIAMNGDPRKPEIAAAQSYFAVKTYQAEQVEIVPQSNDPMLVQLELLKQFRLKQLEQEEQLKLLEAQNQQLATQHLQLNDRLGEIEYVQNQARIALTALPPASAEVPVKKIDDQVREIVNRHSAASGLKQDEVWRHLYHEFYYRFRRVVKKQKGESKLQAFVRLGLTQQLYDLALTLYGAKAA